MNYKCYPMAAHSHPSMPSAASTAQIGCRVWTSNSYDRSIWLCSAGHSGGRWNPKKSKFEHLMN